MATSNASIVSSSVDGVDEDNERKKTTPENVQTPEPSVKSDLNTNYADSQKQEECSEIEGTSIDKPVTSKNSEQSQNAGSPAKTIKSGSKIPAMECDLEANQEKAASMETSAKLDSVKQTSGIAGKPEYKSEISIEDNVFEDGTRTSEIQNKPIPETSNGRTSLGSQEEQQRREVPEERPAVEMLVRRSRTESTESISDKPVLTFNASKNVEAIKDEETEPQDDYVCLLCDRSYPSDNKEDVLAHLVLMHKFVIADVALIGNLAEYMRYWKKRFQEKPFAEFCSNIVTNVGVKDDASKEEFFLLCDAHPEDKEVRENLQRKKLELVLAHQQKEREETKFCRQCLFCNQTFCGNRAVLIDHLVRDHSFHVGKPDNLVFTDELFDLIQSKLDSNLCLFCEKPFKDKASLKEHMRKKQHRKINPKLKEYDRFYVINYMEMGKNWKNLQIGGKERADSVDINSSEEDEWAGWNEETETKVVCLFCDVACVAVTDLQEHMKEKHSFDLHDVITKMQLNFYQKVKLINFIRQQVYHKTCYGCKQTFEIRDELEAHFNETDHIQNIPDAETWDQPEYFFPTYEDDSLLFNLDDVSDNADEVDEPEDDLDAPIIKEDIVIAGTILNDKKLQVVSQA